jgi:MFS family permease
MLAAVAGPKKRWTVGPAWQLIAYLWVCYALNHADRQVMNTMLPALQRELRYGDATLGLMGAVFLWSYGIFSPVAGVLGDRMSKARLVVGSLAVWSALTVLSGMAPNGPFLLACRALLGLAEAMFFPAAYALIAAAHGAESRSKAVAIFGTSVTAGVAIGGALSALVAERFHWRMPFWLLGTAGLAFTFPLLRFFNRMPREFDGGGEGPRVEIGKGFSLFRIPTFRMLAVCGGVATFGLSLVDAWLPTILMEKFPIGLGHAGVEASVFPQVGFMLGMLGGAALADRYATRSRASRFWALFIVFLAWSPCLILLGLSWSLPVARAAALAYGLCSGGRSSNTVPAAFDIVPASLRASTVGLLNLVGAFVSGFGPFLGGLTRRVIGLNRLMAFTGVLYLCTAMLLLYVILKHVGHDTAEAAASSARNESPS